MSAHELFKTTATAHWRLVFGAWSKRINDGAVTEYDIEHEEPARVTLTGERRCSACGVELVPMQLICAARLAVKR